MPDLLQSALELGRNKNIAKEEYAVVTEKKEAAEFTVFTESIELVDNGEELTSSVQLALTKNGYLEIEVYCPDDFLVLSRRVITSEVFTLNAFELPIRFQRDRLHPGKNFTRITFSTAAQEVYVPVSIEVPVRTRLDDYEPKKAQLELANLYYDFRKHLMDSTDWARESLKVIGPVNGTDRQAMFLMLFKAQLHIELEQYTDAAGLLEYVSELLQKISYKDQAMTAYFAYVRALYERDRTKTDETIGWLRTMYKKAPSWEILWILFQMDAGYEETPGLKLDDIASEFDRGCSSTLLFFEALDIFLQYPGYLSDASNFELHILNLGKKMSHLSSQLSARLTEIFMLMTEKELSARNLPLAERILKYLYTCYPTRDLLRVLCRVLIAQNDRSEQAGVFYDVAVREYLDDIPEIFRFYISTRKAGNYELIPIRILEHYEKTSGILLGDRNWFFANITANKSKKPEYYRAYENAILAYAEQQMKAGAVDLDLAVIYRDIIENGKLSHTMRVRLFEVLSSKEIVCHNERMRNVMVFHDELNVYQDIPLKQGRARVKIYSRDAVILFKDITGNIYANISYDRIDFLDSSEWIDLCVKGVPISDYMLMHDTMPLLRSYKDPSEILNYMTHKMDTSSFRGGYVRKLINDTVLYFSRNLRDTGIYDEMLAFFQYDLEPETKGKLIEVMIEQTFYRDAFEKIREDGFAHVSNGSLSKLTAALVDLVSYRPDDLLLQMAEQCFKKAPFDPRIYKYMVKNYNGDPEVLIEMYRAGKAYQEPFDNLPERILRRTVESGEDSDLIPQIFARYYSDGDDEQLKKDYMTFKALRYLYDGDKKGSDVFRYIENDLMQRKNFSTETIVAYLKYMSDKDISGKRRIRLIEVQLKALAGRGIMLEEFKNYGKCFTLPAAIANSIIITSFGKNCTVSVDLISGDRTVHKEEPMKEIFKDCYALYITLFYGESVVYSLDGKKKVRVKYDDLQIQEDESRYAELNNIIRMKETGNILALNLAAKEYFVKDRLMEHLF